MKADAPREAVPLRKPRYILLRILFWTATSIFASCALINTISAFGYDLTQVVAAWRTDGSEYQGLAFLPLGIAFGLMLLTLRLGYHGQWKDLGATQKLPRWLKFAGIAMVIYWVAIMAYMAIAFDFGGPEIHNGVGVIWLKGQSRYLQVSPAAYHHAVAVVTLFTSAWGMVAFANFALAYWNWLQEAEAAG